MLSFNKWGALLSGEVTLLDIGARGSLPENWRRAQNYLKVLAFDPDPDSIETDFPQSDSFEKTGHLLGENEGVTDFFVYQEGGQSSIFAPTVNLSVFASRHNQGREIKETQKMSIVTLDKYLASRTSPIDAMKLDVQGSELSVLLGSQNLIAADSPFIFLESWSYPVYDRFPLIHDVLNFLSAMGYFIFDTDTAAAWYYKNELDGYGRSRQIGLNLLLVPDLDMLLSR